MRKRARMRGEVKENIRKVESRRKQENVTDLE